MRTTFTADDVFREAERHLGSGPQPQEGGGRTSPAPTAVPNGSIAETHQHLDYIDTQIEQIGQQIGRLQGL
jgi:hypothetical protein